MARMTWAPDYALGWTEEKYSREAETDLGLFGTREEAERVVRMTGIEDPVEVRRAADFYRRSASPGAVKALSEMNREIDVRHVLPTIHVPTLVVHGTEDKAVPFAWGSYLAERNLSCMYCSLPCGSALALPRPGSKEARRRGPANLDGYLRRLARHATALPEGSQR
jgi:pimeloyl-ACP methyl ester carboxylesterase